MEELSCMCLFDVTTLATPSMKPHCAIHYTRTHTHTAAVLKISHLNCADFPKRKSYEIYRYKTQVTLCRNSHPLAKSREDRCQAKAR